MRGALSLLLVAIALAGCSQPPDATVTRDSTPSSPPDDTVATTPATSTPPTPVTPRPTPTPSASPKPSNPTVTPSPPSAPASRPDFTDSRSGWVTPPQSDPTAFTVKFTFPVYAGGNVTARGAITTTTTAGVPPIATPKVVNLTLLDPEGKVAYWQSRQHAVDTTNETLQSNGTLKPGEWSLVYTIQGGASDGTTAGDRYAMSVLVRY